MDNSLRIAVKLPNWLGDVAMSFRFLVSLKATYPDAKIDIIAKLSFKQLPFLTEFNFIEYNDDPFKLGLRLRKHNYDQFWVLPLSFSAAWLAFLTRAKIRIGYKSEARSMLLNFGIKRHPAALRAKHYSFEILGLLQAAVPNAKILPHPHLAPVAAPAKNAIKPKYVVIAPFAAYGSARSWPLEYLNELIDELVKLKFSVVITGVAKDIKFGLALNQKSHNLLGKTSLNELVEIISGADLVITMDSGVSHLAALYGVNTVAIFGSTNPVWTRPIHVNSSVVYSGEWCSPCYQRECPLKHLNCLKKLSPQLVLAECKKYLN